MKEAAAVLLPQERRECSRVTFAAAIPEPSLLLSPLLQPCDQVTHTANCVCWEQKKRGWQEGKSPRHSEEDEIIKSLV